MSKPTSKTHHVATRDGSKSKVEAAYYAHEPTFTVFKATDGSIVASFHNNELVSIVVEPETPDISPRTISVSGVVSGEISRHQHLTNH
jgi:hypothetical protein